MSNVVRSPKRRDCAATRPVEIDPDGIQSLSVSWQSIAVSIEQLEDLGDDLVDELKLVLDARPDGSKEAHAGLRIKQVEKQIRDCVAWSTEASVALARPNQFN